MVNPSSSYHTTPAEQRTYLRWPVKKGGGESPISIEGIGHKKTAYTCIIIIN